MTTSFEEDVQSMIKSIITDGKLFTSDELGLFREGHIVTERFLNGSETTTEEKREVRDELDDFREKIYAEFDTLEHILTLSGYGSPVSSEMLVSSWQSCVAVFPPCWRHLERFR
jgi:hypothetical protein